MATVGDLLREKRGELGIFEARLLLALALRCRTEHLVAHPEEEVPPEAEDVFRESVARRLKGEPYPYISGVQEFFGRPFRVTPDVLIPRPDTELLVETAIGLLKGKAAPRVLDLGTGSGCIAVTVALECPGAEVWACDVSEGALRVARENAGDSGVRFFQSSWFESVPAGAGPFDLILSNPPYVAASSPYLRDLGYEPRSALVSGVDGLDDLRVIAAGAPLRLRSGGWIAVEHGFDQGEACRTLFSSAGFSSVRTLRDLGGNDRVTLGQFS